MFSKVQFPDEKASFSVKKQSIFFFVVHSVLFLSVMCSSLKVKEFYETEAAQTMELFI
jgi:hypothetical protein